jgi:hypothetical protein
MKTAILVVEVLIRLTRHDLFMLSHSFEALHRQVREYPTRGTQRDAAQFEQLRRAVDIACALYPKRVLCLQRSAVLVKVLRRRGVAAKMVIGAQKLPFKAHAWVEVDGRVINDRLVSRELFLVLEVC